MVVGKIGNGGKMKIYFLKRAGKNWFGNFAADYDVQVGNKHFIAGLYFFRRKDAKKYLKRYDTEFGNPFEIWSAEVKEDVRDNRKRGKK